MKNQKKSIKNKSIKVKSREFSIVAKPAQRILTAAGWMRTKLKELGISKGLKGSIKRKDS